ncbi:hypothetical protein [Paenibacillus ferrarius]|uniref:hypothetical protein n=1 Tax=Paenibacillus ferrarius TaxID=1469647 RepID=UPI003D2B1B8F
MWIGLLGIIGCYGISIALIHLLFGIRNKRGKKPTNVVLVTKNNQSQIEWVIRSMFFFSRIKGKPVKATIIDEGSSDETREIIERLSQTHALDFRIQTDFDAIDRFLREHDDDPVVLIHLSNREDLVRVPV